VKPALSLGESIHSKIRTKGFDVIAFLVYLQKRVGDKEDLSWEKSSFLPAKDQFHGILLSYI